MLNAVKKHLKIIKTCNLYISFLSLGLSISLTGPCLLDLQHMVHTDTGHIALIYTARSIGYLIGAICGGILLDIIKSKQAVLMLCNFFVCVSMFGIPWTRSYATLMGFMVVNGAALGAIETGANVICLELWGKDSGPFFQGMHFSFGLGGLVSPLIAAPFLGDRNELPFSENTTYFVNSINSTGNISNYVNDSIHNVGNIAYPFSIVGAICLLATVLLLSACIISPTEESVPREDKLDDAGSLCSMFFTVVFTFLIFFVVAGIEIGYGQTLTTYAVKGPLHSSPTTGSYMTSAFWASFTISRLASVFISMKINNLVLVIGDICIVSVSALILLFFMPNEWALWLASVVFGTGIGPSYAALVGWINTRIYITNKFSAIFTVGCAAGEMVVPFIIAYFMDAVPEMLTFVTAAASILMVILLFSVHCILKNKNDIVEEDKKPDCYVISERNGQECYHMSTTSTAS